MFYPDTGKSLFFQRLNSPQKHHKTFLSSVEIPQNHTVLLTLVVRGFKLFFSKIFPIHPSSLEAQFHAVPNFIKLCVAAKSDGLILSPFPP